MLICNGRLIDPAQNLDAQLDVRIRGGIVVEIGVDLAPEYDEAVFDASGACVAPGFIDMHVHLREPGNPEKETIASGTAAAVAGGFTAVAAMPNTNPAIDSPQRVADLQTLCAHAFCHVYPVAAITHGRSGVTLLDYPALERAGAVAFSDDGNTVMDAGVLREAALSARAVRGPFIVHCEDEHMKSGTLTAPAVSEDVVVARDGLLARETQKAWHIAHVTTRGAFEAIAWSRALGAPVTCEVTPHHLTFTSDLLESAGAGAKVNPPLRTQSDVRAVREAVRSGEIDALASDHAPHTEHEKTGSLRNAAVGFTGLEIAVGAYAHALPDLPLSRFVRLLSTNPAKILRVAGGSLAIGSPGDVTVFADRPWIVDPQRFHSKGKSTPFSGMTLPRRAIATIVGGELRMRDGRLPSEART